ncbi:MAG TPA: glycosyltransferase family 9 protein, partial [Lacipirellulaceae bacterium]|nr:glycosyltransferase family 9 protein [Lacipirellulaceae bacterium]
RWRPVPLPTVAGYLQVSQAAGAPPVAPVLELATTAADQRAAEAVWQRLGWDPRTRVAVLNTGGAFGAAKDWPGEHFAALARRLAVEQNLSVLVNCGPKEREVARAIATAAAHPRVASLADEAELPIGLTKAVIRRAALLVTTDSGPRFFGVAFGVPTVTLFGPTSTVLTQTYSPHETSVSLGLECQPCMQRTCPLKHHACLRDLSVERVLAAAVSGMGAEPRAAGNGQAAAAGTRAA